MPPVTDEQLVARINAGHHPAAGQAFEALYRRHRDYVLHVTTRFAHGDTHLALDAMQDTFTTLLRQFPGFTLTAKLTTYLYPVAKNATHAAARQRRRTPTNADAPLPSVPAPQAPDNPAADPTQLDHLLAPLSPEHREVVLLRFVDDMPLADIATALDLPLGTVKSRLHHALTKLREHPATKNFF
ncbi:MAG: sigma-70 family RNA polymerase sigma factor [Planctomycetota bacterium]